MNRGSSFAKSLQEDSQKSEEKCKAFKDICKYFSKEEWGKLGNSQKCTYVYMKRNYDTMTGLDERPQETSDLQHLKEMPKKPGSKEYDLKTLPETHGSEPAQKQLCPPGKANASSQQMEKTQTLKTNVWAYRLRERKNIVVYEEISDLEEDD
ncbi:protein SSX4-like [Pteropus alecto]|uniref:protein SSX4-like n=1 Tax=Pteropus alecto TaxID=9402 RepID=UPI0003F1008A|nr:protein SSX4-like [Pteropus alecto]